MVSPAHDHSGPSTAPLQKLPSDGELLHTLIDNIPDAIYFKDRESRFVRVNRFKLKKIGAHCHDDVVGKTDFDFFSPEHARQAFDNEQSIIATGRPMVGIEEKETWPDRPDTWVSTTKMPFRNKNGEILGTFGVSRDITEIKKYRDALQDARDELEDRVKDRTVALREAKFRLEQNLEQLKFLNVTSYRLVQIVEIEKICSAIVSAFMARFPGSRSALCLRKKTSFGCVFANGFLALPEARVLCETALQQFQDHELAAPVMVADWRAAPYLNLQWPAEAAENPCWIAIPLVADNKTLAIVQLFAPSGGETVYYQEKILLSTLAAHAAASLSNAINFKELETKARLEGELEAARNIQQSLTPTAMPDIPHITIAGIYRPAYEVGGDYLDYFPCGDGSWAVMVADVCGKGVPAALLMTILRSVARVEARTHFSAKSLLCAINQAICFNIGERSFITALCLVINAQGTSMTYARAGHNKMLKLDPRERTIVPVESDGIALGIISDEGAFADFLDEVFIPLEPGKVFLAYTDGVSEAADARDEFYGLARLKESALHAGDGRTDRFLEEILSDLYGFVKEEQAHDDITMFAMTVGA
jgi:sigma-B regulation protein RsbU (phosphoserine phosphatase)